MGHENSAIIQPKRGDSSKSMRSRLYQPPLAHPVEDASPARRVRPPRPRRCDTAADDHSPGAASAFARVRHEICADELLCAVLMAQALATELGDADRTVFTSRTRAIVQMSHLLGSYCHQRAPLR
jgi:hypothetical protein